MGRIFCMGNIHGHYREFYQRLDQLGNLHTIIDEGGEDRLILLGNYIDNDPNSFKVLNLIYCFQLCSPENLIVLRGNREQMLLNWLDACTKPGAGNSDAYGSLPQSGWLNADSDFQAFRFLIPEEPWEAFQQLLPATPKAELNRTAAQMVLDTNRELINWLRQLPCYYETETQLFIHADVTKETGKNRDWGTSEDMPLWKHPPQAGPFCKDIIAGHVGTAAISNVKDFHDIFWDGKTHYYCDGSTSISGRIPVLVYDCDSKQYFSLGEDLKENKIQFQVRGALHPISKYAI